MFTAQLRLNVPHRKWTGPTCHVHQFQKVEKMMRDRDKDWRQTGRGGDREGEQTYVSSTSVVG